MADIDIVELVRQGSAAARAGDQEAARRYFERAITLDSRNVNAWLGLCGVIEPREEKVRCFERVLELDPSNTEAVAGLEWIKKSDGAKSPTPVTPPVHEPEPMYCVNHPDTETLLRCNRCGKPICGRCGVRTPVGIRCKECVAEQQKIYFTAASYDYPIVALVTLALSVIAAFVILFVVRLIPFYGWLLMIFVAPATAGLLAEIVRRSVGGRRARYQSLITSVSAALGSALGLGILWLVTGALPLLVFGIYAVLLVSTLYARTR